MDLFPAVSGVFIVITVILDCVYAYFWFTVFHAIRHHHINYDVVSDKKLQKAYEQATKKHQTNKFLLQITTKGGAISVVQRGIDYIQLAAKKYPFLTTNTWVEVITEDESEVEYLKKRYANSPITVHGYCLPKGYETPKRTRFKARALHYMVELHRKKPVDCFVVHYDEESVLTPENLVRLEIELLNKQIVVSEGQISYALDWDQTNIVCKAMESNRPFGCHECYLVMTSPPPLHLHGSNLVIKESAENAVGWDIGTLNGNALIAEDLVFGLTAYAKLGKKAFGWHRVEMIEQPPFTVKAAFKQRERWVFGALQAINHAQQLPEWRSLSRIDRIKISGLIKLRIYTYALGFPVSLFALISNIVMVSLLALHFISVIDFTLPSYQVNAISVILFMGLVFWLGGTQLGLYYNLRYTSFSTFRKIREHLTVLVVAPFAGIIDTMGPLSAVFKWYTGQRKVGWTPTPKLANLEQRKDAT